MNVNKMFFLNEELMVSTLRASWLMFLLLLGTSSENRSCPAKKGDDEKLMEKRSSEREDDEEKAKTGSKKQIARLEKLLEVQIFYVVKYLCHSFK